MGLDEVGTARTLREHRKVSDALVEKHGGRLVKSTGDGVLLEFPSVVDAVECASNPMRETGNLLSRINLICPVQSLLQKDSASRPTQIKSISLTVPSHRGATRDRHGRGAGCGGR
jgi:hypothetical protein